MQITKISPAKLSWKSDGTPFSHEFTDIYFSSGEGLTESQYVFLKQNKLPERWLSWDLPSFYIGETGFGTGLNLLVLWQAFKEFRQQNPNHILKQLFFISFEKSPLKADDLLKSHSIWPSLHNAADELATKYPEPTLGKHTFSLDNEGIIVELWFGDINKTIHQMKNNFNHLIDCWFLDGFAPSKNPDMWQISLFNQLAALAAPNCHLATFTAAGVVRRGLIKAGFKIKKSTGFGRKREMLVGTFTNSLDCS